METNIKPYFIISVMFHLAVFISASVNVHKRITHVTIPIDFIAPEQPQQQEIPVPVKKNPWIPARQSKPAPKTIKIITEKPDKETVVADKITVKKINKKENTASNLEKLMEQSAPDEPAPALQQKQVSTIPGGLSIEGVKFPYTYYLIQVRNKINENWAYSKDAGNNRAVIYFKILRNGTVESVKIKESSGDNFFDRISLRAVELASPFPQLPSQFSEPYLGIFFEFVFHE